MEERILVGSLPMMLFCTAEAAHDRCYSKPSNVAVTCHNALRHGGCGGHGPAHTPEAAPAAGMRVGAIWPAQQGQLQLSHSGAVEAPCKPYRPPPKTLHARR